MRQQHFTCILVTLACVLHIGFVTPAMAQETEALGDDYVAGDFGRLLYQENGVTIRRASTDAEPSLERVAGLNAPVFPGDGVITAFDQRAEIQLAGGSLVRIDRATDLTFLSLPNPYAEVVDNTVLQLEQGVIRIDALLTSDSDFRIDTPAATVFLLDDADIRIDVDPSGATRVASFHGVVEVTTDQGTVLVRSGNKTSIYPDQGPERPIAFNTLRRDKFDRWVGDRDLLYRDNESYADSRDAYEALPDEVRPYYRELSAHGRWVHADDYGWVWYPDSVAADWRPYYDGYWSYGRRGYFWVSHEPWGWAPYHYGRWGYVGGSWCWIPGRVFGGAWVAWSWGSLYVGWSPLGYWNTAYCGSPFYYGYYGPSWSFVNYSHFHYRSYRHHAVPWHHIDRHHLTDNAVVTRPPRAAPRKLARSADARDRALRDTQLDRVAHLRPVDKEVRGARNNLRGAETRLVRERAARIEDVQNRLSAPGAKHRPGGRAGRDPNPGAPNRSAIRANNGGKREIGEAPRGGADVMRREATGGVLHRGTSRRATTDSGRPTARPSDGARSSRGHVSRSKPGETTRRRMRDVYESAADPRSRRGDTARGSSPGRRPKATTPRPSPRAPKASTPRNTGSRPKASPSRSRSSGSRPKASPSRSSGARSRGKKD